MQLLLTDRLTCPRCGPTFGLILRADVMAERRVREGVLGCPNCRDSFHVRGGFADLRAPPRGPIGEGLAGSVPRDWPGRDGDSAGGEKADRIKALLGVQRGPGTVALIGGPARWAARLSEAVEDLEVVVVDADTADWPDRPGVSRIVSSPGLPFFGGTLRGAVVDGRLGKAVLFEASRVTAPMSRVVVDGASPEAVSILEDAGLTVLVQDPETVVAARG